MEHTNADNVYESKEGSKPKKPQRVETRMQKKHKEIDKVIMAGMIGTGLILGANKVMAEASPVAPPTTNTSIRIEEKNGMPSASLPIVDSRISEVAGVRSDAKPTSASEAKPPAAEVVVTPEQRYKNEAIDLFFKNLTPDQKQRVDKDVDKMIAFYSQYNTPADYIRVIQYDSLIDRYAKMHGVDRNLAQSILFIESRGIHDDESDAGAKGLWQLMPDTARERGLKVDLENGIDERTDPDKSTDAALAYLAKMKDDSFGNSGLEVTAYNWGWGHVLKAVNNNGLDMNKTNIQEIKDRTPQMPKEARDYADKAAAQYVLLKMYRDAKLGGQ
jgi:hypothetical protein